MLLIATPAAFFLSLLARLLVESSLANRVPLFGDFISLAFMENRGIAFGITFPPLLQGFLVALALLFVCFLAYEHRQDVLGSIAFGMILGGAIANIVDRMDDGFVTDFIAVGSFPIFNIADSFITVGVGLLLLWEWVRVRKKAEKKERAEGAGR